MQIAINENNEITGYAAVGNILNGKEINCDIPNDFAPNKYIWQPSSNEIILNPNYIEPKMAPQPTLEEALSYISTLEKQIGDLTSTLQSVSKSIEEMQNK